MENCVRGLRGQEKSDTFFPGNKEVQERGECMKELDMRLLRTGGRNSLDDQVLYLGWSGSYVEFDTDSRWVDVLVRTDAQTGEGWQPARMAAEADGSVLEVKTLRESAEHWHLEMPCGPAGSFHRVRLSKITEGAFGLAGIEQICLEEGSVMRCPEKPEKHIEFIGDSITCGYGVEAASTDTFSTATENAVLGYASLASRAFRASCDLVAWSGTGLISRWVPPEAEAPNLDLLMPELYGYRTPELHRRLGKAPAKLGPGENMPDLVIINLGTNDSSWTRGIAERVDAFGKAYGAFLQTVSGMRPHVPILCILGVMGQELCPEVERQVQLFRERNADARIDYLELPVQLAEDGMGADGHPSRVTQEKTAAVLVKKIEAFCGWKAGN